MLGSVRTKVRTHPGRSAARQHPADLAADAGQERIAGISGRAHRLGHHLHRGDRAGAVAGIGLHALGTLDRTAVATTTALARLVLAVHRTFRCAFGTRRARRTRSLGGGAIGTGGRRGSALLAFHAWLARATRTAFAAALTVTATTATTAAGTAATAATASTLFLGGAGFALRGRSGRRFRCPRLPRLPPGPGVPARQRRQQFLGDRLGRNLLLDVGLDVRQAHGVALAGEADRVALFPRRAVRPMRCT